MGDEVKGVFDDVTGRSEEKSARAESGSARGRGLGELDPKAIQSLINMFQSNIFAGLGPQMQFAQQRLAAGGGRSGLTGSGLQRQLSAGIPGQFSLGALQKAVPLGAGVASQRAQIASGKDPIVRSGLGAAIDTGGAVAEQFQGK